MTKGVQSDPPTIRLVYQEISLFVSMLHLEIHKPIAHNPNKFYEATRRVKFL